MGFFDKLNKRYFDANVDGNPINTTSNLIGTFTKDLVVDLSRQFKEIGEEMVDQFNNEFRPNSTKFTRVDSLSAAKHQNNINGSFQFKVDGEELFTKMNGLQLINGFNSEIGITRRKFDYDGLSDSIERLDFEIPKDVHEFKELNPKLYDDHITGEPWGPEHAEVIRGLKETSDTTLTIEGPPYVHTNRSWMESQGVETEYSGKNLSLLRSLANKAKNERDGDNVTMADYLYAHMQYVDMQKYDKEYFDHKVETMWDADMVHPVAGMNLKPTKKEVDKPLTEVADRSSKRHEFPTFDERMKQHGKDNPRHDGMSVAPRQDMDIGLEI